MKNLNFKQNNFNSFIVEKEWRGKIVVFPAL